MATHRHLSTRPRAGFTLIEMSVVILLLASIIGSVAIIFNTLLRSYQEDETRDKLEAIQRAIYEYRVAFNTLPCPADITLNLGHTHFGVAAANPGVCTGGVPAANFSGTDATPQEARGGLVPVTTLQLPPDYAFDGWGRRIMYYVSRDLTQSGALNIVNGIDPTPRMTILNEQGVANTTLAAYVLISGGPNGHGMFPRVGGAVRINNGSTNADEQNNCDCDNTATASPVNSIFVQKDITENPADNLGGFDDIVVYGTRVDMILQASMSWSLGPQFVFTPGGDSNGGVTTGGAGPGGGADPVCNASGGACFPAGTAISTPGGERRIEELNAGDIVFAVDANGVRSPVRVKATMRKNSATLTVVTDRGLLRTTTEHPLWVGGDDFREAGRLKPGDTVMLWQ
ncbi:MAG: prepilin-type N-terminal cleavage/methylation domain-containing protein, partial [Proteobacteria bacterium]|nr:prepilin-type N-terminal cleavage/methylation domain-containing protein [Pseudomonadota bacterium]